jgi:hypothetical protein
MNASWGVFWVAFLPGQARHLTWIILYVISYKLEIKVSWIDLSEMSDSAQLFQLVHKQ